MDEGEALADAGIASLFRNVVGICFCVINYFSSLFPRLVSLLGDEREDSISPFYIESLGLVSGQSDRGFCHFRDFADHIRNV